MVEKGDCDFCPKRKVKVEEVFAKGTSALMCRRCAQDTLSKFKRRRKHGRKI